MSEDNNETATSDIFLQTPLYERLNLDALNPKAFQNLHDFLMSSVPGSPLDAHCIECQSQGTFIGDKVELKAWLPKSEISSPSQPGHFYQESLHQRIVLVEFRCARDESHRMYFSFFLDGDVLIKTGQYPSIADLSVYEIRKYRKVLTNEKYKELSRAIGLASHGVGIGGFVYLRRIFEDLIEEAHQIASSTAKETDSEARTEFSWDEDKFQAARMEEKILLLRKYLPPFLVQNRNLYAILSKGIHSLSEDECLKYFNLVRVGIELILDEKLEALQRQEKIERVTREVGLVHGELSNSGGQ